MRKVVAAVLAAILLAAAGGAIAQSFQPFVVKDIRVEGLQRTEAGTVFSYLPIKVGERMDEDMARKAVRALYATGFFQDVRLEVDNDVLLVFVQERPAIAQIDFAGQSAQMGWMSYVSFLALISISLGVLNLLPIPLLDGGHLMYYAIEIVKGGPVSERVMELGQRVGLALLLVMMAFAFYNDLNRLLTG